MKPTGIKTSPVNQGQKSSKKEQARKAMQDAGNKMPMKDKLVGGSGGFGLLGGGGGLIGKIASRFLGKASKTTKAFQNAPKQYNKLAKGNQTKQVPIIGKPGKTTTVPKSSTTKQVSYANPRISMTRAQREAAGY